MTLSIQEWDQLLAIRRQLCGEHWPDNTFAMWARLEAIRETASIAALQSDQKRAQTLFTLMREAAEELKREALITLGADNHEYQRVMASLNF